MTVRLGNGVRLEGPRGDDLYWPELPEWQRGAPCIGMTTVFFSTSPPSIAAAKAVCAGCDVKLDCRRWALDNNECWGVWGGLDEDERQRIRVKRRRMAWRDKNRGL